MPTFKASRTLVKSPPEVWAEIEQVERLAELLGDDAITITRAEPESAIEWQGATASGTIEIKESSWGTKVDLTAEVSDVPPAVVQPVVIAELIAEPVAIAIEPEPETVVAPEAILEQAEPIADAAALEPAAKASFWAKVVSMFNSEVELAAPTDPGHLQDPEPVAVEPEPVAVEPEPEPEPLPEPETEPEPDPPVIDYGELLTGVLDHLGSAHKRPFTSN